MDHLRRSPRIQAFLLLALLPSCSVVDRPTLPYSPEYNQALPAGKYVIVPGDQLEVRFFHTPEYNLTLPVRPDGYISLPLVKEVRASGITAEELAGELTKRFGRELRQPEITVIVRSFGGQEIHVGGRVEKQGVVPLTHAMTVLDSLFAAGGPQPEARLSEVVVIRRTLDKGLQVIPVDINSVLSGKDSTQNIYLLPYDAVYVPNSPIANVNKWVNLYIRQNIPINFGLRPTIGL